MRTHVTGSCPQCRVHGHGIYRTTHRSFCVCQLNIVYKSAKKVREKEYKTEFWSLFPVVVVVAFLIFWTLWPTIILILLGGNRKAIYAFGLLRCNMWHVHQFQLNGARECNICSGQQDKSICLPISVLPAEGPNDDYSIIPHNCFL